MSALWFELKTQERTIFRVKNYTDCTGGMGNLKPVVVPPEGYLVQDIHFGGAWKLPDWATEERTCQVQMRAVYAPVKEDLSGYEQIFSSRDSELRNDFERPAQCLGWENFHHLAGF
jgi:hypothetical protein